MSALSRLTGKLNTHQLRRTPGRIFISGTGRAGTTFLVQLLTDLGLDTGYSRKRAAEDTGESAEGFFATARAGVERDIFAADNPLIVKSPYLCDHVDDLLKAGIGISHIIIPVRNLHDAAESRRFVQRETTGNSNGDSVAGGLWDTSDAQSQEAVLAMKLARLIEAATRNEIPLTLLSFPRLVRDSDYTYEKLAFLFPFTSRARFRKKFTSRQRLDWVHDFSDAESRSSRE